MTGRAPCAALSAWRAGDMARTKQNLNAASRRFDNSRAEWFADRLPSAMPDWNRAAKPAPAMGEALLIGGIAAEASYAEPGGAKLRIRLTACNDMIAKMAEMFDNAAAMDAMGGTVRTGGQTAILTRDGRIIALVGDRVPAIIDGDAPEVAKIAYLS